MMTNKCVWLLSALLLTIPVFGQLDLLAEWPLNSLNEASPSPTADIQASNFERGNGISEITFSSSGARTRYWPGETNRGVVDFYEVCITPDQGITIQPTQLEFSESRTATGARAFEVHWSTDGFQTSKQILGQAIPENTDERKHIISNLNIDICNENTLCFRWYAYRAVDDNGEWKLGSNSLKIKGQKFSTCSPPANLGSMNIGTITDNSIDITLNHGNGSGRVVVMREGSPVNASSAPCNGITYNGDTTFGDGDQIAPGEFVVYADNGAIGMNQTSFTVSGLLDGATYHFAVFEFNGNCYQQQAFITDSAATICNSPNKIRKVTHSGTDKKISFLMDVPPCFDQVLVVAGFTAITGFPTGNGSQYSIDSEFGKGNGGSDFGANEFPVFFGNANRFDVTGVQNNTVYHFTFFVRKGNSWIESSKMSAKPAQGCDDLVGKDNVFINEIEYRTHPYDVDEGIELAGVAGVNLDAYEIYVYGLVVNTARNGEVIKIVKPSGTIDDEQNGMGAVWIPIPDLPSTCGFAIYNKVTQTVIQFLSYNRNLKAIDGVAVGQTAVPLLNSGGTNVLEHGFSGFNKTLQLIGTGSCPGDFSWVSETLQTRGGLNSTQAFIPLPIELLSFTAKAVEEKVLLSWQTLTETNNDYMAIEKSKDAKDFEEIGVVKGAGTTFEPQSYQLWDERPYQGINYYRLRQVDFDGTTTLSDIVSVVFDGKGWGVKVFPSLANDFIKIQMDQATDTDGHVRIFDLSGRLRHQQVLGAGSLSLGINIAHLHSGQFIVQIERSAGISIQRITKL